MRFTMLKEKIKWFFLAAVILSVFSTTCEMPMGLGPPIDTVSPNVFIDSPQDNTKMKAITQGNPIVLEGTWNDDIGVVSLQFDIIDKWNGQKTVIPSKTKYKISTSGFSEGWVTGSWIAEIVINADKATEYRIRVYALDKFGNKGMAEVNVQIDIIPPWVDTVRIQKHPNHPLYKDKFVQDSTNYKKEDTGSTTGKKDSLPNLDYYMEKINLSDLKAWRDIKHEDLDEFQNEFFRLSANISSTFDNVAATRLNIYNESGRLVNPQDDPIKPTGFSQPTDPVGLTHLRYPYWDITHAYLKSLNESFDSGAHYISFEIRAWSKTDWTGADDTGYPVKDPATNEEEPGRSQRIGGTVWYPESDNPNSYIDKKLFVGNTKTIRLMSNKDDALIVDLYDDDLLDEAYLGLVSKDDITALRTAVSGGEKTEDEYFDLLATSASERTNVIAKFINKSKNPDGNLFTLVDSDSEGNRHRERKLSTLGEGEFRLIAMVKEAGKTTPDYSFKPGESAKWTVYPPIVVQVQDEAAPLIIIEKPMKENVFPELNQDGQTFLMSGYSLSASKIAKILIAWAPDQKTMEQANTVLDNVEDSLGIGGGFTDPVTGIKVWNVEISEMPKEVFGSVEYYKTHFEKVFDILNDFTVNGAVENKNKLFVIRAINETGRPATKTYRLSGSNVSPLVTVTSHGLTAYHNRNNDLVLIMKVTGGADGVALKPSSIKITDSTTSTPVSLILTNQNDEYSATIPRATIQTYPEGSTREYTFEAENILGNKGQVKSSIIMSDAPLIESITCSEGAGSYKIGDSLTFEVTLSMPVAVTGTPRLKLYFNLNSASDPASGTAVTTYADFIRTSDNMTNVISFKYTVKEGDNTPDKVKTISDNATDAIILNGGTLTSSYGSNALLRAQPGRNLQSKQAVVIDGIRPYIVRAYFEQIMTAPSFFNHGKTITVVLECSEPVLVSGSPVTYISTKTGTVRTYNADYSSKDSGTLLKFTYTVNDPAATLPAQQLKWGHGTNGTFFMDSAPGITDMVGNTITLTNLPTGNNLDGTGTPDRRAFIKTTPPARPGLSIHPTPANAQSNVNGLTGTPIKTSGQNLGMRVTGVETVTVADVTAENTLYYSLNGGSSPKSNLATGTGGIKYSNNTTGESNPANTGYLTSAYNCVPDLNYATRNSTTYNPSSYQVTVWQTDKAGNRSPDQVVEVNINSRPAELVSTDIGLPDGVYGSNTEVPFKLFFSQKISVSTATKITLSFTGTETGKTGSVSNLQIDVPRTAAESPASSLIILKWKVTSGTATMKDIKITDIQFTYNGNNYFTDEYGNNLTRYNGSAADNGVTRPIANGDSFNISRAGIEIRSNRPRLSQSDTSSRQTTPMIPTTGSSQNGDKIATNGSLNLVFTENANAPVTITAVPGKYITIKPYGKWAIPPELSVAEFNSVNNHPNIDGNANAATWRRRLSDVDNDGIPKSGSGYGSGYNLYIKNTHGLTTGDGNYVRPDTETKMILDFNTDLYDGTNAANLREIFNAAEWKWQKILVTSTGIVSINNNVVNIDLSKLSEELGKGRIWEVLIDDGAFQDAAGNKSEPVSANAYRFWTEGTATPYIRADRVSYDANNYGSTTHQNVTLGFVSSANAPLYPPIDTRVRIDCETPGSDIRYDVIRTSYALKADGTYSSTTNTGTSTAFTIGGAANNALSHNNQAFFAHTPNYNSNTAGTARGYLNNTIGDTNTKENGFYSTLLVPIVVETPASGFTLTNGTFAMSTLTNMGTNFTMSTGKVYQTYNTSTGARSWSTDTTTTRDQFVYIGELYGKNVTANIADRRATSDTDGRLYSGRRDYIVAKAKKSAVSGNADVNGPALDISNYGMEGVYKTTVLYRDPRRGNTNQNPLYRLLIQGFDVPVMPVVAGFPLRDANSTNSNTDAYNNYFSKSAYRYGSNNTNNALTTASTGQVIATNNGNVTTQGTNHHIWVSWEIVTDWYQKGKGFQSATDGNYMSVTNSANANSVLGTYGGVIYRWRQLFYN